MKNKILIYGILAVFFVFGFFMLKGNMTGKVIGFNNKIVDLDKVLDRETSVLFIDKRPNSVLDISYESDKVLDVFVEIDDCEYWLLNSRDKDDSVLYTGLGNSFTVGDPSYETSEQIDLYITDKLCLIFVNLEHPENSMLKLEVFERDNDKWKVLE